MLSLPLVIRIPWNFSANPWKLTRKPKIYPTGKKAQVQR